MKPQLLKIQPGIDYSFSVRQDVVPHFYNRWHYHPEYELLYIERGFGTQFIGDSIQPFEEGDVVLVGSNLPHYWRCDDIYFQENSKLTAKATVVHFKEDFWGNDFLDLPENKPIKEVLHKAKRGLQVKGKAGEEVAMMLKQMLAASGAEKIILLLSALNLISKNMKTNNILCSPGYTHYIESKDPERLNQVYNFTYKNFHRKITLEEVAALACMSTHSFCRYFKTHTRKTYSQFLQEVRIGYACKLLIENKQTISEICYNSGFNNLTNFYKFFKSITGKTPNRYQKDHVGEFV
jgi:AraC-like DNA-binding protein